MRKTDLSIGDEVAYKEHAGSIPCKARVVGFRTGDCGIKLSVNRSFTAFNLKPEDQWEEVWAKNNQVYDYWWKYEKWNRDNRKAEEERDNLIAHRVLLEREIEKVLDKHGVSYQAMGGGYVISSREMAKFLGIKLFLAKG